MDFSINRPVYLFSDDPIAHQQRLVRRWFPATVFPHPSLVPDQPYEGSFLAMFGTVVPLPDNRYRMYYQDFQHRGHWVAGRNPPGGKVMIAESDDGFRWNKPTLDLVPLPGYPVSNTVILPGSGDSPSVIHDPTDTDNPWKLILFQHQPGTFDPSEPMWGLHAYFSRDGLRWVKHPDRVLQAGDRTNVMPDRVNGHYVIYTRGTDTWTRYPGRTICRSESPDFIHWTQPELVLFPDLDDEPDIEFYGMSVFERHGWHFGLLEYWDGARDLLATHLAISRDGIHWMRPARTPFIGPAFDWNRAWSGCASNGPLFIRDQMVFYFGGRWTSHSYDTAQQYGAIGYASLGIDRFCALEATTGGQFETAPLCWPGGELELNADTRESFNSHPGMCNGRIEVELFDASGTPLPEWSGDNRGTFSGNTHCRNRINPGLVQWKSDRTLHTLQGRTFRIRFHLVHARLFTFSART